MQGELLYLSSFQVLDGCLHCDVFPPQAAFAVSQRLGTVLPSFSLASMSLFSSSLISCLTLSSFRRMVLHLHVFEILPNFFLWFSSNFKALWCENRQGTIPILGIGSDLICDPVCGLFWRKFRAHLRRMCIQLHLDVKFCKYLWNPSGPVYHLKLLFLWRCCA